MRRFCGKDHGRPRRRGRRTESPQHAIAQDTGRRTESPQHARTAQDTRHTPNRPALIATDASSFMTGQHLVIEGGVLAK